MNRAVTNKQYPDSYLDQVGVRISLSKLQLHFISFVRCLVVFEKNKQKKKTLENLMMLFISGDFGVAH